MKRISFTSLGQIVLGVLLAVGLAMAPVGCCEKKCSPCQTKACQKKPCDKPCAKPCDKPCKKPAEKKNTDEGEES